MDTKNQVAGTASSSISNKSINLTNSSSVLLSPRPSANEQDILLTNNNNFYPSRKDFSTNYELVYHQHLQTAIQMGQFYNPELSHHSMASAAAAAAALAIRGSNSSTNAGLHSLVNGNQRNAGVNGTVAGLWGDGGNRSTPLGYHHNHNHLLLGHQSQDLLSISNSNTIPCEIWPSPESNTRTGLNGQVYRSGQPKSSSKKPRRRVATVAQRRAANIRERRRMSNLNEAFDRLRRKVPTFAYEKRLSRIETLRLAITYISFMGDILSVPPDDERLNKLAKSVNSSHINSSDRNGSNHHHHPNLINNNSAGSTVNNGHFTHGMTSIQSSNNINSPGGAGRNLILGPIDCHQNQNVPPISPFTLSRIYPPHHQHHNPSHSYINSSIHQ